MTLQQKIHHSNLIADAIQRHEDEYFVSLKEGNGLINYDIALPTPQKCGTSIQQRSYAMSKAMDIIEGLER